MSMQPDWENIAIFVRDGQLPFPNSCVKGLIRKSTLDWDEVPEPIPTTEHPFDIIRESIKRLVTKHKIKKVGVWLSGGIDSSLLTALTAELLGPENVTAYTLRFEGSDETPYAKTTVDHVGCNWVVEDMTLEHHCSLLRTTIQNAMTPVGFTTHKLRIAQISNNEEHVFSALGLDELCGGYEAHVWASDEDFAELERQKFEEANYNFVWINAEESKHARFKLHYPYLDPEVIGKFRSFPRELKTKGEETKVMIRDELRSSNLIPPSTIELGKTAGTKGGFLPNILTWWNQGYNKWAFPNAKEGQRLLDENLPDNPIKLGSKTAIRLETFVRRSTRLTKLAKQVFKRRGGTLGGRSNLWIIARLASIPILVDILEKGE
ncbi:MAG: asparagine synthase C-terminal domain-containing protein [Candidatus Odinarchaeota archaeon]